MAWRAARSLLVLHQQLQAGAPRAKPPGTGAAEWGIIGDAAHDPTSDHSPHDFPGWGNQIVTAADFPNRPDLGLDAHKVLDDIRRTRDPRAKYGISNGQIFSNHAVGSYGAWVWRPYSGSDKHFTHGHLSVVGDARADGTGPWATIGGDMATLDDKLPGWSETGTNALAVVMELRKAEFVDINATGYGAPKPGSALGLILGKLDAALKALGVAQSDIDELQARPAVQLTNEQASALADKVASALAAHPDNPLGEADKPAIVEAVKTALREGLGA